MRAGQTGSISQFCKAAVGKKAVMAVTGYLLFLFIVGHMIGNLKFFAGVDPASNLHKLDLYGEFLRTVGYPMFGREQLLWIARLGLLGTLFLHIASAVLITRQNKYGRPFNYIKRDYAVTNYAARTMWFSGVIISLFVVYHILHFTTGHLHFQGFEHGQVYDNVSNAFQVWYVALIYFVSMAALCFHLYHGIWSAMQTLGIYKLSLEKKFQWLAKGIAIIIFLGYISVPLSALCFPCSVSG